MDPHAILSHFTARQSAILNSIKEIVEIESPSHDAVRNREVVDWVEQCAMCTGADLSIERLAVQDGDHLVIRAFPADVKPVLLLGHTDTVHPVGTNLQNPTRIEGDKFYGCGIFDMKSGIVLMLEALRFFAETGVSPGRPITIVLSCDEEVGSTTGRWLVEREAANADHCLVFEPSAAGRVKTGRKGTGMYTLRARGLPAHAGLEPEKGANAIVELARHMEQLSGFANPDLGSTVNVTTFHGGTATNVIPAGAACEIDVRFASMGEAERIDSAIHGLDPVDARVSLETLGGINRPPMERTAEVVQLYERASRLAATFGYRLGETQVGGASDGNFVAALGVPVLDGLGIAGDGAHTLEEHILVSDVAGRATLITMLLTDLT
ncbi:MAG TPA: M20 family metallopeptidase [Pyrinomonadaceae bacterium]|nr:M20 family metallopeptidase [Pyrinomonadaceae bacterium]